MTLYDPRAVESACATVADSGVTAFALASLRVQKCLRANSRPEPDFR